ncbi:chromosome segregation protein SMC [Bifidobacterium sp. H6bp22N]|uniref:chromosome segregation protein SMC n=1 Tax=Bifidobacterium polysaccharolyticum TaxID=2750967 RepID=UPI0028BD548D|nr:chromosome segregation protein SMC [Bifidobacterium sp. H6bp22N]MDT7506963.1 chromosome segregation protein SMC [Bifidobacterium sp. H6bp22N]
MYLKELTLKGFKSFASATTLRFEPGITAVVGPNGSGKSNIVDALAWVMGEQGAKSLRGGSMEDVIFAGTSSRPPLGRAQVTLTIDNTDRTLDIDYTEVTISRTIYRNGGSEYAINGSDCRLLDIQELLSDTGLGQQMHVIVGQGRLDAILRADPAGHRAFIEEAAGILKHRKRKERALHKLANTEANLSRLDDLIGEIHRQLGPLGRQAKVSRRADMIQISLRDAQARIHADDALTSQKKLEDLRSQMVETRGRLARGQEDLTRVKLRIEQLEGLDRQSSPALDAVNQQWNDLTKLGERAGSLASLARERSCSLEAGMVADQGQDPGVLRRRADELKGQAGQEEGQVGADRIALDGCVQARADLERRLAAHRQTMTELRQAARKRQARLGDLAQLVAKEESALELSRQRERDLTRQQDHVREGLERARNRVRDLDNQEENPEQDGRQALDQAGQVRDQARSRLNDLQERERRIQSDAISAQAKADALADTLDHRGAGEALSQAGDPALLGLLTDFVRVEDGWEEPLAQALHDYASALVAKDGQTVDRTLERARQDRLGRAALISASGLIKGAGVRPGDGPWRPAADLVTLREHPADPDRAQGVLDAVRSLLASTAAVDDVNQAHHALEDGWQQALTRLGDLYDRVGAVGGSAPATSDLALTARRDKALAQVEALQEESKTLQPQMEAARAVLEQAEQKLQEARNQCTEARVKAEQAARDLAAARKESDRAQAGVKDLDDRLAQVRDQVGTHKLKLEDLKAGLARAQEDGESDSDDPEGMEDRQHELETALDQARTAEMEAKLTWTESDRRYASLLRQIDLLRDQAEQAERHRQRIGEENRRRKAGMASLGLIALRADLLAQLIKERMERAARRRDQLRAKASAHDKELTDLRASRDALEPKVAGLRQDEHGLDLEREHLAGEDGRLRQRIQDDLGMEPEELIREYGPDRPVPVLDDEGNPVPLDQEGMGEGGDSPAFKTVPYRRGEQEKRLAKAKRGLAALGKVNPLATEEYEALESRNRYLHEQRQDVIGSRDDLMALVKDLDSTMVTVFKEAFDDTAQAFERIFSTLFPGGRGRLRLEDPDDLLTTGVLVEASPAGKRVRRLSLLSGGERSLTALALLLAIFTARPSPFYVMDEVEAALDDVNLTRLLKAFEQLREHAQLIIITHQQRTMGIADALYGVTMRGDGVTAVISQRLKDPDRSGREESEPDQG